LGREETWQWGEGRLVSSDREAALKKQEGQEEGQGRRGGTANPEPSLAGFS